jgi:hypothetical protein
VGLTLRSAGLVAVAALVVLSGAAFVVSPAAQAQPEMARSDAALLALLSPLATASPSEEPVATPLPPPYPTDSPAPTAKPTPRPTAKPKPKPRPVVYPDTVAGARAYVKARIGVAQYNCVSAIWTRESKWNPRAGKPTGAYGIPQAFPGSKMAKFGSNWLTSPITQVKWGIWYVTDRYGSACAAWKFWQVHGWY